VTLFLLIAPPVVLYSQGYRFDFFSKRITQTGSIFLKASPKQADVYINGGLEKRTDFLFGSALIGNLLPKKYQVLIEKDGYLPWEKNLDVKEKMATEAKSVVLFPNNLSFAILSKYVREFWFSSDGKKIILKEENATTGSPQNNNEWALKIYDLERKVKSLLLEEKLIGGNGAELLNLEFSKDGREISLDMGSNEQIKSFSMRLDKLPYVLTENATADAAVPKDILDYQKSNNDIYYLNDSGYVFRADSAFKPIEKINSVPFPIRQETEYELNAAADHVFLREDKTLYLFGKEAGSFEIFFEPVKNFRLSPDSRKIAYFSDNEIWIVFLQSSLEQPQREKDEKLFLTRFSEKIGDIFWINSDYLIFNAGEKIKISEIDNRDGINIYDLAEFKSPKIFFNQMDKKLYILSEENLSFSENLLK
jgi:dipeptidyl aminopeptidase/acylaminoacyl peptidase